MSKSSAHPTLPPPRNIHLLEKDNYEMPRGGWNRMKTEPNPVRPVRVAFERWAGDFHAISEEGYRVSGLVFVEEGVGWFAVEDRTFTVRAPQVFLYPEGRPRRFWCRQTDPWRVWIIEIKTPVDLLANLAGIDAGTWKAAELLGLFQHARDTAREGDWPGLAQYTAVILRELGRRTPMSDARRSPARELAEDFQGLLATTDLRPITSVAQAAERLGTATRPLSDACRTVLGQSAGPLLRRARLRAAETQLANPGQTVKAVAEDFGFADAFAFSKAFRKTMGYPPSRVLSE